MKIFRLESENTELKKNDLKKLGVITWHLDPANYKSELEGICASRGYDYQDTFPDYESKLKEEFEEHLHKDEETRFFIEGNGFIDVRGSEDEWIRIHAVAGDLLTLPAGLYHRYSPDDKHPPKLLRISCGKPVWTYYNRSAATDKLPERVKYVKICMLLADEPPSEEDDYDSGSEESGSEEDEAPESSSEEEDRGVKRKAETAPGNQSKKPKK